MGKFNVFFPTEIVVYLMDHKNGNEISQIPICSSSRGSEGFLCLNV